MEKINKRVSKCLMIASTLTILLAVLTTGSSKTKGEVVKIEPIKYNVLDIDKKVQVMTEPVEAKVEVKQEAEPEVPWMNFKMTHYVATCNGCSGITASGYNVKNTIWYEGYRVLSVDPRIIDEGSIVEIDDGNEKFKAIAIDTGGAIKGRKLDLLVKGKAEAYKEGKKDVQLRVVRNGW